MQQSLLKNTISIQRWVSQHAPELLKLLTDKVKRDQVRWHFQNGYKFSKEQVFALVPIQFGGRCKSQAISSATLDQEARLEVGVVNIC